MNNWWTEEEDAQLKKDARKAVLQAFNRAEKRKKPPVDYLFTDVYDVPSKTLLEQEKEMWTVVNNNDYKSSYQLENHSKK